MASKVGPNIFAFNLGLFVFIFFSTIWDRALFQRIGQQQHCNLAKDIGPCRNYSVLWYYDSAGAICNRFWYGGCGGNANRFSSQEECQSTCVPSNDQEDGGRSLQNPCLMKQEQSAGPCTNFSIKWMYDVSGKACRQFYYGGCKGNLNRFDTEAECESKCLGKPHSRLPLTTAATLIPTTIAISRPGQSYHASQCHSKYETGPCRNFTIKWTYDNEIKACKQFYYGGCHGNNNRFETIDDCQKACIRVKETTVAPRHHTTNHQESGGRAGITRENEDVCELKMETGDCRNYTIKWTYDSHTQSCRRFYYGGCGGNGNRFVSEAECRKECPKRKVHQRRQDRTKKQPQMDLRAPCNLPIRPGTCNEVHLRYYYNPMRDRCQPFKYTGCEGNDNNFISRTACDRKCGSFRDQDVCHIPPAKGACHLSIPMFYYDSNFKKCDKFNFSGCQGNGNIFFTQEECLNYCLSSKLDQPQVGVTSTTQPPTTRMNPNDQDLKGAKYLHFKMLKSNNKTNFQNMAYKNEENSEEGSVKQQEEDQFFNYNVIS